jgi:hypothetical protein
MNDPSDHEDSWAAEQAAARRLRRCRRDNNPLILIGLAGVLAACSLAIVQRDKLFEVLPRQREVTAQPSASMTHAILRGRGGGDSAQLEMSARSQATPASAGPLVLARRDLAGAQVSPPGPDVALARPPAVAPTPSTSEATPVGERAAAPRATPSAPPPLALRTDEVSRHTHRAMTLLQQGDIAGARLLLARAAAGGSARAAFALAETYDPQRLSAWKAVGIKPDPAKARELYTQALVGGLVEAKTRLSALE